MNIGLVIAKNVEIVNISISYKTNWECECGKQNSSILMSAGHHYELCGGCKKFADVNIEGKTIINFMNNNKQLKLS